MLLTFLILCFKGKIVDDLPKPYGDEMKGIANATNVNLSEIVLYNIFYEIFTLCTSIVGQDSAVYIWLVFTK